MRLTSDLLANAISFAKSQPGMAEALHARDNNSNLYLAGIVCRMGGDESLPNKFFLRVTFDYADIDNPNTKRPDVFVDLKVSDSGNFEVLPPPPTLL